MKELTDFEHRSIDLLVTAGYFRDADDFYQFAVKMALRQYIEFPKLSISMEPLAPKDPEPTEKPQEIKQSEPKPKQPLRKANGCRKKGIQEQIKKLWVDEKIRNQSEIGRRVGLKPPTVRYHLLQLGLLDEPEEETTEDTIEEANNKKIPLKQRILKLSQSGLDERQISEKLGLPIQNVKFFLGKKYTPSNTGEALALLANENLSLR